MNHQMMINLIPKFLDKKASYKEPKKVQKYALKSQLQVYSQVLIKQVGPNKRAGCIFYVYFINE